MGEAVYLIRFYPVLPIAARVITGSYKTNDQVCVSFRLAASVLSDNRGQIMRR